MAIIATKGKKQEEKRERERHFVSPINCNEHLCVYCSYSMCGKRGKKEVEIEERSRVIAFLECEFVIHHFLLSLRSPNNNKETLC